MRRIIGLSLAACLALQPAWAQTSAAPGSPALVPAAGNPNLSVASVRMADGVRASKVIGAAVTGSDNTELGTVSDLMLDAHHTVVYAIVSVGAVMGMGGKLVAIPVAQLQTAADGKFVLPGASKDTLNAMPTFVYNN